MSQLARTLGMRDLVLLIIGTVIGSGIFLVPGTVLSQVNGQVLPAMLVWVAGGTLSMLGALTYGELSAANPRAGGLYVYIGDCFGPLAAFLYGWTLFFVISSGSLAALAVAFSTYLNHVVPLTPALGKAVAVSMIGAVTIVNVRGTRQSADLQNWMTGMKIGAVVLMSLVLVIAGREATASREAALSVAPEGSLVTGFGLAMIGVLWAYEGWQYATFSAGETIDPQRTFPRAYLISLAALIGIYLLANVGYLAALGADGASGTESIAASAVAVVAGPHAAGLVAMAILLSIFSAANGLTLTAPRVYYAMANDGLFFRRLGEVHPRFGTPAFAVVAGGTWSAVLALTGTFQQLLTYVVFAGWLFYALGAATVFVYRRADPGAPRPYRVPGYPWTPLLFIVAAAAIVVNTVLVEPGRAAVGVCLVVIGLPMYALWVWRRHDAVGGARKASGDERQ